MELEQNRRLLKEELDRTTKDNLKEMASLTSLAKMVRYAETTWGKHIGKGSSRIVYRLPNGNVLKLAFNKKGLAQNRKECGDYYKNGLNCFPNVYECSDDDYLWCEVQPAPQAKKSDFKKLWGISLEDAYVIMEYECYRITNRGFRYDLTEEQNHILQTIYDEDDSKPYYLTLHDLILDYIPNYGGDRTLVGDLSRVCNWGIVERDDGRKDLVVIDSGIDEEVFNTYYKRNR